MNSLPSIIDKITPTDSRIQWITQSLNGKTYEFILAEPSDSIIDTIFLIHGFPDLAYGWRYQIPCLLSLGYRVVVPNMMGYGGTDAPESPEFYTVKRACDDLAALVSQLGLAKIVIGGHDWGGVVVYQFALRYSTLVTKFFVICTPYLPPREDIFPLSSRPNFKYQLQMAGPEVESSIVGQEKLKQFFSGMFGGRTSHGESLFSPTHGVHFDRLNLVGPPPLLSESELDFYVKSYMRNGMRAVNWYRNPKLNFENDREILRNIKGEPIFHMPAMYMACSNDSVLSPSLSEGMDIWFTNLTRTEVSASHWAMVEKSQDVNRHIKEFLCGRDSKSVL